MCTESLGAPKISRNARENPYQQLLVTHLAGRTGQRKNCVSENNWDTQGGNQSLAGSSARPASRDSRPRAPESIADNTHAQAHVHQKPGFYAIQRNGTDTAHAEFLNDREKRKKSESPRAEEPGCTGARQAQNTRQGTGNGRQTRR